MAETSSTVELEAVVRAGLVGDLDVLTGFNQALAKETEDLDLPEPTLRAGVNSVLTGQQGARYFVVQLGTQVVACLMLTYEWSDWRNSNVWWIQSVYVHPEHRRNGHFRRLYNHVRAQAQQEGASGLRLYADTANERAQTTYTSLGMTSHYKVFEDLFTSY